MENDNVNANDTGEKTSDAPVSDKPSDKGDKFIPKQRFDDVNEKRKHAEMALEEVAEELSNAGVTVTLSYKGDLVATLGSQAKPKLSSILTGTRSIEINNPIKLIELGL